MKSNPILGELTYGYIDDKNSTFRTIKSNDYRYVIKQLRNNKFRFITQN